MLEYTFLLIVVRVFCIVEDSQTCRLLPNMLKIFPNCHNNAYSISLRHSKT